MQKIGWGYKTKNNSDDTLFAMKNFVFFTAIFLLASCGSPTGNNSKYTIAESSTSTDPERTEGKALFQENCASCHNPMKDATGPALNRQLIQDRSDDWIFNLITDQKHLQKDSAYNARVKAFGSSCPQVPISREQLKALVSRIRNPHTGF